MTPTEYEQMTPFERELLAELRKLRVAVENLNETLRKAVE